MKTIRSCGLALLATVAVGTFLPASAEAQNRRNRPSSTRTEWAVRPLVIRAERDSNAFRAWFERNGSRKDNNLKREIQRLDENLEALRNRASDGRPGVGRDELNRALGNARKIDRNISRGRQGRVTVREWNGLQRTLNDLARLYNVRGV